MLRFPGHQISWVSDWVIEYAIFLRGLAQQWRLQKKQNYSVGQYCAKSYTQNMHVEWKIVTGNPLLAQKLTEFTKMWCMCNTSGLGDGNHVTGLIIFLICALLELLKSYVDSLWQKLNYLAFLSIVIPEHKCFGSRGIK